MMKNFLFRRFLITYLIIAALLLVSLEIYLSREIKDNYVSNLRESLIIQARLIAGQIPLSFTDNLDDFCKRFKTQTGSRITIIDETGKVLGDSDEPSEKMENHANRPEIKDAEINDIGYSIRFSNTLKKNLFYLTIALNRDGEKRFLRLSLPLHDVETAMNEIRKRIIIASLSVPLIAFLIGLFQTRRITKSVEEIAQFSKEVASGNFRKRLFLKEKGELGELGKNISNMAEELQTRLRQSEEEKLKIEAILGNMSDGLIVTDTRGRIVLSNAAVRNLFGIGSSPDGKTLMEALRKAELMEVVESVIKNREKVSRDIETTHPRELYIMATALPFILQKEISGVVLTFHDITRLRKLEEMRKDFVANVSHEIKTPITAIKGFAETLLDGAIDDRENALRFIETIKNHSERLNSLVSDLLTLSRIEFGDIKIDKTNVNLNEVADAVFSTVKDKAESKGLYLKQEIPQDVQMILADRNRLIQILINLVDNGIKFTEKGGVTLKVQSSKFKVAEEEKDIVEISVEDTGTGIPRKHLTRLGERFYRVDSARSRELGGTGLGLAIVKHLVKAHGWEMKIESAEARGTKVSLFCPLG